MTSAVLVKRVLVCSKIPKLLPALRAALPAVRFTEISPEDVDRDEATGGWRKEVIVADGDFIPTLFRKPKDAIEFVQVNGNCKLRKRTKVWGHLSYSEARPFQFCTTWQPCP